MSSNEMRLSPSMSVTLTASMNDSISRSYNKESSSNLFMRGERSQSDGFQYQGYDI